MEEFFCDGIATADDGVDRRIGGGGGVESVDLIAFTTIRGFRASDRGEDVVLHLRRENLLCFFFGCFFGFFSSTKSGKLTVVV